jgi:hypothetical protein
MSRRRRRPDVEEPLNQDSGPTGGRLENGKVKHGKGSPSGTRPLEPAPNSQLTTVPAGQHRNGGRDRVEPVTPSVSDPTSLHRAVRRMVRDREGSIDSRR